MINKSTSIAITGASGFIGGRLAERLLGSNRPIINLGRSRMNKVEENYFVDFNEPDFDLEGAFTDAEVVIHCAARTHVMNEVESDPLDAYLKFNTKATIRLAEQAARAGVKRFIYLSSIKAVGESTAKGTPMSVTSPNAPVDEYGISKARAEEGLLAVAKKTGMEITIIRPPLVYGKGVKANFAAMLALAKKNLPLPLASVKNKRSIVALDNLVDLIITCIDHKNAGNQIFMVSDGSDVSTPELLALMTMAYGKQPRLFQFPPQLLKFGARCLGKGAIADRLLGSLEVDIEHTREQLNWVPRVRMEDVLKEMVSDSTS